jgi:enoyl-CoA hydratase/carnithine racemase
MHPSESLSAAVSSQRRGAITLITLSRPDVRNAVDAETARALYAAFVEFQDDAQAELIAPFINEVSEAPQLPAFARLAGVVEAQAAKDAALAAAREAEPERTAVAGSLAAGHALAEIVRRLQRERPDARAQWETYCGETLGGVKDPLKHTVASLRRFLLMV